jgi:hypothetical protein
VPAFGRFSVGRPIRTAYIELEEPEAITKARFEKMLKAYDGQGPEGENLVFLTRHDLWRLKLLPREMATTHLKDLVSALRDRGVELVVLIALRCLATGNLKDQEVAERLNEALDFLTHETGSALALAHHSRKEEADTVEAQGIGSTFISARADASFDIGRAGDGLRRVKAEARYSVPEQFFLRKELSGEGGELIQWVEAPPDAKRVEREALVGRVASGESVYKAAKAAGVNYATAKRWVADARDAS